MLPRSGKEHKPPEPADHHLSREDEVARRERIAAKVAEIRASLPHWALLPPWRAERFIEPGIVVRTQAELPFDGGVE
ncbi:MAG TPA: hypothetical protein VHX65_19865 [Pirellulales bacterium]|jgi:hypothetical protein|nr:hypothetical protein [Pirellulales bacterium]